MEKIKQIIGISLAMLSMPFVIVCLGILKLAGVEVEDPQAPQWPLWISILLGMTTIVTLAVYSIPGLIAYVVCTTTLFIWWLFKILRH